MANSSLPLLERTSDVQARPASRPTVRSIYYHPLGLTESAEIRRLLPGINSAIASATQEMQPSIEVTGDEWALPRFRKAQDKAAYWDGMKAAMRSIEPRTLQQSAPWSGSRLRTPSVRDAPRQRKMLDRSASGFVVRSTSSSRDNVPSNGVPPSIVPDLLEMLTSYDKQAPNAVKGNGAPLRRSQSTSAK